MRILNQRDKREIARDVTVARSVLARLVGLIGRDSMAEGSALIIPGCRQVHTWLMRFSIDILFCDRQNRIISALENVKPFRLTGYYSSASYTIELPAGTISAFGLKQGDVMLIEDSYV